MFWGARDDACERRDANWVLVELLVELSGGLHGIVRWRNGEEVAIDAYSF